MAAFRSRIRHFRAPVVVTLALGAMPACSGKTAGQGDGDDTTETAGQADGGDTTETAGQSDGGDTTATSSCPAAAPISGSDCDYAGPPCDYDYCGTIPTRVAVCNDGAWAVSLTSCNPPPPPLATCPAEMPQPGTYCDYVGPACGYGATSCGFPLQEAICVDSVWLITATPCNPPPPTTVCPGVKPVPGTACDYVGPSCGYDPCSGSPVTIASCLNGLWDVAMGSCNPPPPTCPVAAPVIGSPCDVPAWFGPDCTYVTPCGTLATRCQGGVWIRSPGAAPVPAPEDPADAGISIPGCVR